MESITKFPALSLLETAKNGTRQTCTVELTVVDDGLYEKDEKAVIRLVQSTENNFNGLKPTGSLTLTIMDNDPQPMLSIGDATVTEGGKLAFTVTRAGAKENALSVKAATAADETGTHLRDSWF